MRMYLDDEMVRRNQSYLTTFVIIEGSRSPFFKYFLHDIEISVDKGRFYLDIDNNGYIPPIFVGFATDFSIQKMHEKGVREEGIYKNSDEFGEAVAKVGMTENGQKFHVTVTGTKMDDVIALYQAIRDGSIRPAIPVNVPQMGMSVAQMETIIDGLSDTCEKLTRQRDEAQGTIAKMDEKTSQCWWCRFRVWMDATSRRP